MLPACRLRALATSCLHSICAVSVPPPLGSAPLAPVCIAFRLTASAPWLLVAIRLRRNRAAKFAASITAKSLNLNARDLLASKFSGRPRDFKI